MVKILLCKIHIILNDYASHGRTLQPSEVKKTEFPFQATRLSPADLKTHGFPSPPRGGFGFLNY
jgi:hypothetical protein